MHFHRASGPVNICTAVLLAIISVPVQGSVPTAHPRIGQSSAGSDSESFDNESFHSELVRLSEELQENPSAKDLKELQKALPASWTVTHGEKSYAISTEPLRKDLASHSIEKAELWLSHLMDLTSDSQPRGIDSAAASDELKQILSNPAYGGARPPGPMDRIRQRIQEWLGRALEKFFGGVARHPIGAEILFWLIMVAAVGLVAAAVYQFLGRRDHVEGLQHTAAILIERSWREWLRSAREAANRGDFREAVHCAYWAGIGRLEETGNIPRDRSKTPREALRLLKESGVDSSGPVRQPKASLQTLTNLFERIWYARQAAGPADFRESLRQLENLGCPSD